ncbi:MAG: glycosyltransferase [Oscillospiraceae bacterium]|nr:glycosyltransferase [Oscillospiraceae bacterium]
MKRILVLSDAASIQDLNNRSNLNILIEMNCEIHIGCNFFSGNTTSPERVYAFRDELTYAGIAHHQLSFIPSRNPLEKQPAAAAEIEGLMDEYGFDLIHCLTPSCLQCAGLAAQKRRIPVIFTSYGLPFYKGAPFYKRLLYLPKLKKAAKYADMLICCNYEDFEFANDKLPAKHIKRIPSLGLDPYRFRAPTVDRAHMRELMELPQNAVTMITIGALTAEKNHAVILKALSHLTMLEIHYVICGAGPKAEYLYQLTRQLHLEDKVHFTKHRDDVANLLHACDIFCLPSKQEGIGMAALEAMEAGLPLITSDVQGINDFMENGVTGFMFAPNDVKGFTAGIEALTEDKRLRKRMGDHNRFAVEPFYRANTERIMREIFQMYIGNDEGSSGGRKRKKKRRVSSES